MCVCLLSPRAAVRRKSLTPISHIIRCRHRDFSRTWNDKWQVPMWCWWWNLSTWNGSWNVNRSVANFYLFPCYYFKWISSFSFSPWSLPQSRYPYQWSLNKRNHLWELDFVSTFLKPIYLKGNLTLLLVRFCDKTMTTYRYCWTMSSIAIERRI